MESTGPTGTAAELDGNRDAQLDNFDINIKDLINLPELFVHFSFEISFSFNFSLVFGQTFSFLFSFSF